MVRWGVLGTAQIAKVCVIPAILKSSNGVLQAIASRDLVKAQALVDELRRGVAYESYAALLKDPEIDAVYIPLPNHLHKEWTIRALEAGKHVLVEKPFAMNAGEAQEMVDAAHRHDRPLDVHPPPIPGSALEDRRESGRRLVPDRGDAAGDAVR